jgi:hypothetical protein
LVRPAGARTGRAGTGEAYRWIGQVSDLDQTQIGATGGDGAVTEHEQVCRPAAVGGQSLILETAGTAGRNGHSITGQDLQPIRCVLEMTEDGEIAVIVQPGCSVSDVHEMLQLLVHCDGSFGHVTFVDEDEAWHEPAY